MEKHEHSLEADKETGLGDGNGWKGKKSNVMNCMFLSSPNSYFEICYNPHGMELADGACGEVTRFR